MRAAPTVLVARLIGVTSGSLVTYSVAPSGDTSLRYAPEGIVIGAPAVLVATLIGVTVPSPEFATHAVVPSGVIAIENGSEPTGIAGPGVRRGVDRCHGVCVLVGYVRRLAVGVIATAADRHRPESRAGDEGGQVDRGHGVVEVVHDVCGPRRGPAIDMVAGPWPADLRCGSLSDR